MRPSVTVRDGICLSSDTDPTEPALDRLVRDPGDDESPPSLAVAILTLSHPPFISAPFSYQSREGAVVKSDPKIERARLSRSLFDLSALRFQRRREGKDWKMKWCPAYSLLVVRQSHTGSGSGWFDFSAKQACSGCADWSSQFSEANLEDPLVSKIKYEKEMVSRTSQILTVVNNLRSRSCWSDLIWVQQTCVIRN